MPWTDKTFAPRRTPYETPAPAAVTAGKLRRLREALQEPRDDDPLAPKQTYVIIHRGQHVGTLTASCADEAVDRWAVQHNGGDDTDVVAFDAPRDL